MSSFVFMRALESAAYRYDRGMRLLSLGRIGGLYTRVAELAAAPSLRVLDLGCGTGGVALACAARGAEVVGIDRSADMLEVARSKPFPFGSRGSVEWHQLTVAEIEDRFDPGSFDAVTACLLFSELTPDERTYTLPIALGLLCPGGALVVADEVAPRSIALRLPYRAARLPLALATALLAGASTRPVDGLVEAIGESGFLDVDELRPWPDLAIITARRPLEAA